MTYEYFGVVTKVKESRAGELRGLARFEKGARYCQELWTAM